MSDYIDFAIVQKRVAVSNQIRGLAAEYGIVFPQRSAALRQALHEALEDASNGLTVIARSILKQLYEDWLKLIQQTEEIEETLKSLSSQTPLWQQLQSIPGIGPLIASAFIAYAGDGKQFNNGRQLAAWLGLVPRQASSGGKTQLGKITKNGNRYLRCILIHGARAAIQRRALRHDALGDWMQSLVNRRGFNKACVAYANKCARICWSIMVNNDVFQVSKAFA